MDFWRIRGTQHVHTGKFFGYVYFYSEMESGNIRLPLIACQEKSQKLSSLYWGNIVFKFLMQDLTYVIFNRFRVIGQNL